MSLGTIALVALGVLAVLAILNRRAVGRLFGAASTQVGKVGRWAAEADPLAVYKERVDNGVDNIAKAKKALEGSAALVRSVTRQVEDGEKEKTRLENRIKVALDAGDKNNTAREYALQLQGVETDLKANQEQLAKHKETYENFAKQVELNQKKVQDARQEARSLGLQLEQSEREKEFVKFAQEFESAKFDDDGLAGAKEKVLQRIDANRAAGDVARDLSRQSVAEAADDELERQAAADDILARFKKDKPGA